MWMQRVDRKSDTVKSSTKTPSHLKYVVKRDGSLKFSKSTNASSLPSSPVPAGKLSRSVTEVNRMELLSSPTNAFHQQQTPLKADPTDVSTYLSPVAGDDATTDNSVVHDEFYNEDDDGALMDSGSFMQPQHRKQHKQHNRVGHGGGASSAPPGHQSQHHHHNASEHPALLQNDADLSVVSNSRKHQLTTRLKLPQEALAGRKSAAMIEGNMIERMNALREEKDISRVEFLVKAQQIYNDVMHEIVRQVSVQCTDRGRLLAKIWIRSTELVNHFSQMFVEEKERHVQEEAKTQAQLRTTRLDYLNVVGKLEEMVKSQHRIHEDLMEDQVKKEEEHRDQLATLKEELYRAQAALRNNKQSAPLDRRKSFVKGVPTSNVSSSMPSPSGAQHQDGADESILVQQLRNEIQRQKLALLDATNEITRLADKSFMATTGVNTDPPPVTDRAVSPVAEFLKYWHYSDSDEDDDFDQHSRHHHHQREQQQRDAEKQQQQQTSAGNSRLTSPTTAGSASPHNLTVNSGGVFLPSPTPGGSGKSSNNTSALPSSRSRGQGGVLTSPIVEPTLQNGGDGFSSSSRSSSAAKQPTAAAQSGNPADTPLSM